MEGGKVVYSGQDLWKKSKFEFGMKMSSLGVMGGDSGNG